MELNDNNTITLPVLPLRGMVVFPRSIIHFDVGRKQSISAINRAMKSDQLIFLAAQKDKLDCDFCQMAHHGQQGVRRTFYEAVKPTFTLWPTPDWLWRNDNGKGDGSGPFKTCDTRIWAAELGVKEYYVSKNGLITLNF